MLELANVNSYYGKTPIIQGINFSLKKGQCLCVLGRNGVGKTTLLRTIMGLTTSMDGELLINGTDYAKKQTHLRANAGLGYVPQGRRILGKFSVRENIVLGTFARDDNNNTLPSSCLKLFPYLAENLDKRAGLLSGGQQQQLAIARALATDPGILLLDEPTEGIQPNIVEEIQNTLHHLNKEMGMTLILTEQHIKIAKKLADVFIIMDIGRAVAQGPIEELTDELINQHLTI
ncbi:MAG: urea ABC transporter ATP-binding subunit UrtE [Gammaproteobacteria bacterium]|nr:urea ABC transporter ATP-binding subunit UrtE [Gammaproteobacteria bacterium]